MKGCYHSLSGEHNPAVSNTTPKTAALIGVGLIALSGLLYIALEITTKWEQAQSPGEKSLGVAVLAMMFGIPMLLCAGAGVLSFVVGGFVAALNRIRRYPTP